MEETIIVNDVEYSKGYVLSKMEAKSFAYNGLFLLESVWDNLKYFEGFTRSNDIIYSFGVPVGMLDESGYFHYREPIVVS